MTAPQDLPLSALNQGVASSDAQQERALLIAIVEQMPGGLIIAEAPSGRVLTVNEHARKLLGIADGESLHGIDRAFRPGGPRYTPEEFPLARALLGETVEGERLEIAGQDGRRFVINVRAAPVRERGGRITAAVSLLEDVTDREDWERAERDFVTNAAHELQSPLAAILSAVEVLQAGAKDTDERDLFIDHIERDSRRLGRLTRALLTLSRAQTEIEEPRTEVVDLGPMLEAIAARMEPAAGVSVTVHSPSDLVVVTNRELLEQLVSNVVRNAVKYTDSGSIRLESELLDREVEIRVVDTGIGISAEALPHVAERFFRVDQAREGSGLGLAIVQASLEVIGGELLVASDGIGTGATVRMRLPLGAKRVPH